MPKSDSARKPKEEVTEAKPCLLSCRKVPHDNPRGGYMHGEDEDGPYDADGVLYCGRCHSWFENCERIKAQASSGLPKPAPAPEPKQGIFKCYHCETCRKQCSLRTGQSICCNCKGVLDAPEPKPGGEEPIDFEAADFLCKEHLGRADVEYWREEICIARAYFAIRAQLAEKEREIEKLKGWPPGMVIDQRYLALRAELAAEKARADRAEERVMELEEKIVRWVMAEEALDHYCNGPDEHCDDEPGVEADLADEVDVAKSDLDSEARSILAARARKEGGSR